MSEYLNNPLFWISILSALSALGMYSINRKLLNINFAKPRVEIVRISTALLKHDDSGGQEGRPLIIMNIINPSSLGNHFKARLLTRRYSQALENRAYCVTGPGTGGEYIELPAFGHMLIEFYLTNDIAERNLYKEMTVCIEDIRNKKTFLRFRFCDFGEK